MPKISQCKLCNMDDVQFSPSDSNASIARRYGVSKDSARRHRKHMDTDPYFNIPNSMITSRGITRRLEDGSYEKVNWTPNAPVHLELASTAYDDLVTVFDSPSPTPTVTIPRTEVVCVADLQLGKGEVNGGTAETLERIRQSVANLVAELETTTPEEIVLADLGDVIENFCNTNSQRETNDLNLTQQIRLARRVIAEIVKEFAPLCQRLVYVAVPSNHSAVRTGVGNKSTAADPNNDFGIDISHAIEERLRENSDYDHVVFLRPENDYLEHVVYRSEVSQTVLGFAHGHQKNNPNQLGQWLSDLAAARWYGIDTVDVMLFGHFHSLRIEQSRGRWVVVAPTQDNGSSWFTNTTGQHSTTGFLKFAVSGGSIFSPNIY